MADARRLLNKREGEIADAQLPGVYFDKVRLDELAEDLITDYKINRRKSLVRAERRVDNMKKAFEGVKVVSITSDRIKAYIQDRLEQGAAHATINRELAALKRLLNLRASATPPKVDRAPKITMLKEHNVRKGFFEHEDFLALLDALPDYLKGFVTFAYVNRLAPG